MIAKSYQRGTQESMRRVLRVALARCAPSETGIIVLITKGYRGGGEEKGYP